MKLRVFVASNGTYLATFDVGPDPLVWPFANDRLGVRQRLSSILAHAAGHRATELTADRFPPRLAELVEDRVARERLLARWS